jgi:O-antigen/teichoic acid export membrane protein/glycosyltransferase involved in cell wall biosynthesis
MGTPLQTDFAAVARNSLAGLTGKSLVKMLSFAFNILVIRWLGDAGYGQYVLIWSYITIFAMFSDAGLGVYAIREIARQKSSSPFLTGNIVSLRLALAGLTMLAIWAVTWWIGYPPPFLQQVMLASVILLLYAIQDPLDSLLQALERFDLATIAVVSGQIGFVAAGLVVLGLGGHITGLIMVALLNVVISAVVAYRLLQPYRHYLQWRITPGQWGQYLRAAVWFGLIKVWLSWSLRIDLVIVSWFWAAEVVGWYGAAYTLIIGLAIFSNAINNALYPAFSRRYGRGETTLVQLYEAGLKYLLLIGLPIAAGIFWTADRWVQLFFGQDFMPAAPVLAVLVWVIPLAFVSEFMRYALLATDQEKTAVGGLSLAIVTNVGLNLWLIPTYGIVGAAVVAVITEGLLVLLYALSLRAELKSIHFNRAVFRPILATLILLVTLWIGPRPLIWQLFISGAAYALAILFLRILTPFEWQALARFLTSCGAMVLASRQAKKRPHTPAPLVSVLMPVHNGERFIAQAIDSVLGQSYRNFELIIINDASTDNTAQILKQYENHPKMRICHNPTQLGVSPSWNLALQHCQGQFIAKLDADDFYGPDQLESVVDFFRSHPETGLIFSGVNLLYPDGRLEPEMPFLRSWVRTRRKFLPAVLRLCVMRAPTVFANRHCYDRLGGVVAEMKLHSDWEMWVRIAANYPVGYIARRLATYRTSHGENITAQAVVDGRSLHDLQLWLELLANDALPYRLSAAEEAVFRQGIYELEMHFAAMAAYVGNKPMQQAYIEFAEQVLRPRPSDSKLQQMRQVYLNIHQGLHAFRDRRFHLARTFFLTAIKSSPTSCTALWVWNKLLLSFVGRTKWGVLSK